MESLILPVQVNEPPPQRTHTTTNRTQNVPRQKRHG